MAEQSDVLFEPGGDVLIQEGDLVVGASESQDIEHILLAQPGHYVNSPEMGVGLTRRLKSGASPQTLLGLERDIRQHLENDGFTRIERLSVVFDPRSNTLSPDIQATRK